MERREYRTLQRLNQQQRLGFAAAGLGTIDRLITPCWPGWTMGWTTTLVS
jgi:hypothetical protein